MVDQNPGALVHAASCPASVRPAISPWASASPQCSTRSAPPGAGVERGGEVARGEHRGVGGAHRSVDRQRAVLERQPSRLRQRPPGSHAGGQQDRVGLERRAARQPHRPLGLDRLDVGAQAQVDAHLAQPAGDPLARALAQARRLR